MVLKERFDLISYQQKYSHSDTKEYILLNTINPPLGHFMATVLNPRNGIQQNN